VDEMTWFLKGKAYYKLYKSMYDVSEGEVI